MIIFFTKNKTLRSPSPHTSVSWKKIKQIKSYKSLKKNFFLKFFIEKKFSFEKNSQNFSKQIQKFEKLFFFEIFCNFLSTWCFFERHTHALKDSPKIFFVKKFWSFDRNFFTLFLQKKRAFFFDQKLKKISKKSFFSNFYNFLST